MDPTQNIKTQLRDWNLPPLIIGWFRKIGITSLFQWQAECLCDRNVLLGGNLVYSAPTSAGKTLVADFLLLKRVIEERKKALVIEPFVALTREKAFTLKSMLYNTSARVGAFGGTYYTPGGMAAVSVAVCTIEKANNFVNKLINENKLQDLGLIVVDEIHFLGDESRGYQLELLLTKVLFYNSQQQKPEDRIQIIGSSATIPNLESIAKWLNATFYVSEFRPVPLIEKVKIGNKIYEVNSYLKDPNCQPLETIDPSELDLAKDVDDICHICIKSILDQHSTLVFCDTKRECETLAGNLANQIRLAGSRLESDNSNHVDISKKLRANLSGAKISDVIEKLGKCPIGTDPVLRTTINMGVAFHHAGLTSEEREIIEDGFKSGAIKALMATSTLSSGVNLPARKVIIRSPTMYRTGRGKEMLHPTSYKQMVGRAGRKNIDTCGESILICNSENQGFAIKLLKASVRNITSALAHQMLATKGKEPTGLKKALLEVIANNTAKTRQQLDQYLNSTFWLSSSSKEEAIAFESTVTDTLLFLVSMKFIEQIKPNEYKATRLGRAVLVSGLDPDDSLELQEDLHEARKSFCLLNDLHIIYQVTPNDIAKSIELKGWHRYQEIWTALDDVSKSVGERIGVDDYVIARRINGYGKSGIDATERILKRFWVALVINDLINEVALPIICSKYDLPKSTVQQAQRAVAQFAGLVSIFCKELGYDSIAALVTPLESRINFSCQRDLLDLVKLNITRPIARTLFNAGYKTIGDVASAEKSVIEFIIRQNKPFKKDHSFSVDIKDSPTLWVPEMAKSMTTLDYASHIVDTAISCLEMEHNIKITPVYTTTVKNKIKPVHSTTLENKLQAKVLFDEIDILEEMEAEPTSKRGRQDNNHDDSQTRIDENPTTSDSSFEEMVRPNREVPNFVVNYVCKETKGVDKFLNKWRKHFTISLNFKLTRVANESIGANVKQKKRKSTNHENDEFEPTEGLALRLELDSQRYIVTRLYACFDDDLTVHIIDSSDGLSQVRNNLGDILRSQNNVDDFEKDAMPMSSQHEEEKLPSPRKLYTQDIVLTYKVLYAGFDLTQEMLNNYFEWHSFDVSWWMVNNCPNRGLNNCNSSLSLVAKTRWASKYHHFLHTKSRRGGRSPVKRTLEERIRLKDIVKAGKTAILQPLVNEILDELRKRKQARAYYVSEIPSRLTMAQMMVHGMGLNMKSMKDELACYQDLTQQLTTIAQKHYAKSAISLTSLKDVARVLYEDLDLKKYLLEHSTKSDISKDPTNSEILNILSVYHPFPKLVQDFRKIHKAIDAVQAVSTHARYNSDLDMMRVFGNCDFWQKTGRMSMSDPDLFLINRNFSVDLPAHGNRELEVIECMPRKCFVPVDGWVLLTADYSQLELRLLAHFSNDKNLLEILNRDLESDEEYDVFKTVASKIYHKPVEQITTENRQHAKQVSYGIFYGMGLTTLSNHLGVDIESASHFHKEFLEAFPGVSVYIEDVVKDCQEFGYVESLLGRRRSLVEINSEHSSLRSKAKRAAINTRIQSSASDIIKLAMKTVDHKIIKDFGNDVRLVLEMHDELIYEVNPHIMEQFSEILKSTMENISELENLRVKLLVNLKKGTNWSNIKSFF